MEWIEDILNVIDIDKILKGDYLKIYMLNKRGQVTLFIIIAVIIIAGVAAYFIFRDSFSAENIPSEIDPIYTNIISCLEETNKEGVEDLSLHGGYYDVPEAISIPYFAEDLPYYYLNSKEYVPSIDKVEGELEDYISNYLGNCLNFEGFEEQGYDINEGDLLVSVNINEDGIKTKLDYPLTISKGDSTKRLREFELEVDSNVEKLLFVSEEVVNSYSETVGFTCLTCLEEISEQNRVEIQANPLIGLQIFENDFIIFSVSEEDYELNWVFIVEA